MGGGCTTDMIRAALESGRWQRVHRGVFAVHAGPLAWPAPALAALLRVGEPAALSHVSAAALHGLTELDPRAPVHVLVPSWRRVVTGPGIVVHRSSRFDEVRLPAGIPGHTRIEPTVLDLVANAQSANQVEMWVTRACQRRLTTPRRLSVEAAQRSRLRWRPLLSSLLDDVADGAQSPLELRYLRLERAHGLPRAHRQRRLAGRRVVWVDADLDEFTLRIELDGRLGHVEEGAFRDRRRDNRGTVEGRATLRYGHAEIFGQGCEVAAEVAQVCQSRGWRGRPRRCGPGCAIRVQDQDREGDFWGL